MKFPHVASPLSESSGFGFPCVFSAHLISSGWFSSCHCSKLSSVSDFPHAVTALFQKSVDVVFLVLSRQIQQAVDGFLYAVTAVSLSSRYDFPQVANVLFQRTMDVVFHVLSHQI